jgi:hypothetical protein
MRHGKSIANSGTRTLAHLRLSQRRKGFLRPLLAIAFLIAQVALDSFNGLSQDEGRTEFGKYLRTLLFNGDLLDDTTFSQIHLAGYYH